MLIEQIKPIWTLDKAIEKVRELNQIANGFGYHLGIGGSVLIKGESHNDVDIYAFPLHTGIEIDMDGFLIALQNKYFQLEEIQDPDYNPEDSFARLFRIDETIDLFIIEE